MAGVETRALCSVESVPLFKGCVNYLIRRMTQPWALRDLVTQRWRQWEVTTTKKRGTAHLMKHVLDQIMHRSEDTAYVIEIAMSKQEPKGK